MENPFKEVSMDELMNPGNCDKCGEPISGQDYCYHDVPHIPENEYLFHTATCCTDSKCQLEYRNGPFPRD